MSEQNPFGNLSMEGVEQAKDTLGGSFIFDTDVYTGTIKMAYAGESSGGARSMTFVIATEDGREYRETVYVTSGRDKGQKPYYERDGKKSPLPGFTIANDMALLATGKALADQPFEAKVVKIYDREHGGEVPTNVQMAVELLGKPIRVAIQRNLENKNVKDAAGNYVPGPDTRDTNSIEKVFHGASGQTVSELTQSRDINVQGEFVGKWLDKNKGQVRDKTGKAGAAAGKAGAPGQPAPTAGKPAGGTNLFGGG